MKTTIIYRYSFLLMLGMGIAFSQNVTASPHMGISFQVFYNELSPFGDWVMDPAHGYVWVPYVDQGFQPYATNGYWEMTNFGNTWVSNFSWGWAPFHYGRWFFSNYYGWAWIPGYDWGPAWVSWRTGGGFYGWAPLGPGMGINASFYAPASHWVFVPQRRFRHRHFHRYFVPHYNVVNIYNRTTIINNTYVHNNNTYITGPGRRDVERATRSRVPVYQVNDSSRPGRAVVQNDRLNVYRPQVAENRSANSTARPSRVISADEYKQRSATQNRSSSSANSVVQSPSRSSNSGTLESRQARPGNQSAASPTRNSAVTPSSNTQTPSRANSSREAQVGSQNRVQHQSSPGISNSGRTPAVNNKRSTQNSPVNRGAVNNPGVTNQSRPATNQVARPASPQNNQRSQSAVRSNTSNRQSQPAVRSQSNSSGRSSSGTVSRGSSNNNSRSASGTRGGSRGGD